MRSGAWCGGSVTGAARVGLPGQLPAWLPLRVPGSEPGSLRASACSFTCRYSRGSTGAPRFTPPRFHGRPTQYLFSLTEGNLERVFAFVKKSEKRKLRFHFTPFQLMKDFIETLYFRIVGGTCTDFADNIDTYEVFRRVPSTQ